ncbi:TPA: Holliday junction resolvase RuvX [Candidatus Poribacteria bacterium]|nr:Holliday junction resolvase RuvX [Candidatus Poribacteria bacterium]
MRLLGLDIGDVLIGVAVSDPDGVIAQGLDSIRRVSLKKDIDTIIKIVNEYEIGKIIIGLPKTLDDKIGIQAEKVLTFINFLKKGTNVPIITWDERLTTVSANKVLIDADMSRKKRKQIADKLSAVIILQGYLDTNEHQNG